MADDDDDSFGEFTFASNHTTVNSASQIPVTTTTDDDDWGDFSSFQTNTITTDHNLKSPPPPPPPDTEPKWEKIEGALPLSLFGDDDDVDENHHGKSVTPVAGNDNVKQLSFSSNNDKSNAKLGINDPIANLYGPSQQQQQQDEISKVVDNGNELDSVWKKSDLLSSFSLNGVAAGNHGSDDEGGWEFINAFSDSKLAGIEKDDKERFEKAVSPVRLQGGSNESIDLFAASNNGAFVESHVRENGFDSKPFASFQNGFTADFKDEFKDTTNELSLNPAAEAESDDFVDSFGEFETALMEQPATKKGLSAETFDPLGSHDSDLFAFSNGVPSGSHKDNNGFDISQISVVQNFVTPDPFSQTEWKETRDDSDSLPCGGSANDENFGKFETTFPASGSKLEGSEASSKNYKEPVPLSIFGIEENSQADTSLNLEHELFKSSTHKNNLRSQSSNLSINDLLSDLYSQAQPITSNGKEYLPHSTCKESISHELDDADDDNFDDGSWEFKDASIQSRVENQNLSFEKKLKYCMDFYSDLKDDLAVVARRHLHGLKKAESTATLAGEEMKMEALDKEIQEALAELHQKDIVLTETDLDDHSEQVISLKQYSETLLEEHFQLLESEYHISRRLSLAESDLRTTIDLINHSIIVLKVLTLAPKGEAADYVSIWYKMISVCSKELKHGTWIWKQSLENNVHSELLSEQQGKLFILALGEIYRAVVILGAAVKFYKPWILLSGADLKGICALLEECRSLWSTSGLEEAIPDESLLEAIKHIRNLDEFAIANEVLSQKEYQCGLSLLSPGLVRDMKMVIWNRDKYFVSLANLWANLISPNPPKPTLHVG